MNIVCIPLMDLSALSISACQFGKSLSTSAAKSNDRVDPDDEISNTDLPFLDNNDNCRIIIGGYCDIAPGDFNNSTVTRPSDVRLNIQ